MKVNYGLTGAMNASNGVTGAMNVRYGITGAADVSYDLTGAMHAKCGVTGISDMNALDRITGSWNFSLRASRQVHVRCPSLA